MQTRAGTQQQLLRLLSVWRQQHATLAYMHHTGSSTDCTAPTSPSMGPAEEGPDQPLPRLEDDSVSSNQYL